MTWYKTGSVTVTSGSTTVAGASTRFVENLMVGDIFYGPDNRLYEITNVASNTSIAISPAYKGSTAAGQAYSVIYTQARNKQLADRAASLIGGYDTAKTLAEGSLQKADNLGELTDKAAARVNLGLGSAATREVVGGSGRLMAEGAFGLIGASVPTSRTQEGFVNDIKAKRFSAGVAGYEWPSNAPAAGYVLSFCGDTLSSSRPFLSLSTNGSELHTVGLHSDSVNLNGATFYRYWNTNNTTVDGSGFLKRASPIINLYSDRIEQPIDGYLEIESVTFERVGAGHYVLTDCPELATEGWYLEQPKDRNNNIYHACDWEYDADTRTLTVRTYEPDYSSGRAENGAPVDIKDGRFIALRFAENPSLYPELDLPEPAQTDQTEPTA